MKLDTTFLSNITILYIEDDEPTKEQVYSILKTFFKDIFLCNNGEDGLETIKKNANKIDIIISDINMPKLNGISMLQELRKLNIDIPIIFTTAYSESKFLLNAIKLNTSDYILKPVDIQELLVKIEDITKEKFNSKLVHIQQKEMQQYINVIDKVAIISRTNLKGVITFVNDRFCETSLFKKDELLGKAHNIIRHPDMSSEIFKGLWGDIKAGKIWSGKVKNRAKNGEAYYVNTTIIPRYNSKEEIIEYIGIRFLITDEENEKRKFKKNILSNIQESRKKEITLKSEVENTKDILKKTQEALSYRNSELEKEKEKTRKQHAQITYYEKKIQNLKQEIEDNKKDNYEKLKYTAFELKKTKNSYELLETKFKKTQEELFSKKNEFQDLNERVSQQAKRINELLDVIEHKESLLKKNRN